MPEAEHPPSIDTHPPEGMAPEVFEAARWIRRFGPELVQLDAFGHLKPLVTAFREVLNEQVHVDIKRKSPIHAVGEHIMRVAGVDPDMIGNILGTGTLQQVDRLLGSSNPQEFWWKNFINQSRKKDHGSIVEQGGMYRVLVRPDHMSQTGGAEELQQAMAAASLEFAQNAFEFGNKPLAYHPNPPDVSGREVVVAKAKTYIDRAKEGALDWSHRSHLSHITTAQSAAVASEDPKKRRIYHTHDASIQVIHGDTWYREVRFPEEQTVRIMRESSDRHRVWYQDISMQEFLGLDTQQLETMLATSDVPIEGWKEIESRDDNDASAPAFCVSAGRGAALDSAVYRYGRRGDAMLHARFNIDTHRMELYWNHVSVDGGAAKQMSFGIAYALQANSGDSQDAFPPLPAMELFPTTRRDQIPNKIQLIMLQSMLQSKRKQHAPIDEYRDNPILQQLVRSLGLSDLVDVLPQQELGDVDRVVSFMNKLWYQPRADALDAFINSHHDPLAPLSAAGREKVRQILLLRMNAQRFTDVVKDAWYGPTAVCAIPGDNRMRLVTTLVPRISLPENHSENRFYPTWWNEPDGIPHILPDPGIENSDEPMGDIRDHLAQMYEVWNLESALGSIGLSTLSTLQEGSEGWRTMTETLGSLTSPDVQSKALIQSQSSDIGGNTTVIDGVSVSIEQFVSAMTSQESERYFAYALASMTRGAKQGESVMIPAARLAMTVTALESLPLDHLPALSDVIDETFQALSPEMPGDPKQLRQVLDETITLWEQSAVTIRKRGKLNDDAVVTPGQIITDLLLNHPQFKSGSPQFRSYMDAIRIIVASGVHYMHSEYLRSIPLVAQEFQRVVQ